MSTGSDPNGPNANYSKPETWQTATQSEVKQAYKGSWPEDTKYVSEYRKWIGQQSRVGIKFAYVRPGTSINWNYCSDYQDFKP